MKIIQWTKAKLGKLRNNKVVELEQRGMSDFSYEGHRQVLAERNSLMDQLSEANRKIADLEKARAFEVQEIQQFLNYQMSHGKKEKDDGKDKETQRLESELGIKISFEDQQSVGEKVIKRFEDHIQSKDEKIRLLKYELAMKDEEMLRLNDQQNRREEEYARQWKGQQDIREEEYAWLMNTIQFVYTDLNNVVTTLDNTLKFRIKNPLEKGMDYMYEEKDLLGAMSSAQAYQ